ncbi:nucleotidyltransferase domain-containing protein [Bacillus sp. 165]|uniref:nucleotidyltransferase domain-containing protein n=1 Tax=Bacillus sp. 165 TaxID=1529117 RepID=UPI001ADC4E2B|nr:nucleotidyltransferase domain-containing protein [Bacillus sp. 165]MBO9128501.1 nucleotidyltransferase domain-containing protein [Bacillus sp. 165]
MKLDAIIAAKRFVNEFHRDCQFALLAGSVSKGLATESSDLDIIVFYEDCPNTRESYVRYDWKIESFVHNHLSYKEYFAKEKQSGRPVLASMIKDGIVLKEHPVINSIKQVAVDYLNEGPESLTPEFIRLSRYFVYDLLDDFVDSKNDEEAMMTLNLLSIQVADFILRVNNQWTGRGKGLVRAFKEFDESFSERYFNTLDEYFRNGNKQPFVELVNEVYVPLGGQLFDGFKQ